MGSNRRRSIRSGRRRLSKNSCKMVRFNCFKAIYYVCKCYEDEVEFKKFVNDLSANEQFIRDLFTIEQNVGSLNINIFKECPEDIIGKLNELLSVPSWDTLQAGQDNDFNGVFLHFYSKFCRRISNKIKFDLDKLIKTKIVIFDFDGTLTSKGTTASSWEMIWTQLGYKSVECKTLHKQFTDKEIEHQEWCNITCDKFKKKNLNKTILKNIALKIGLIPGVKSTLEALSRRNIEIYVLSGSIKQIIKTVFEEHQLLEHINEYMANDFKFTRNGQLKEIIGTHYDFEGKAKYIKELINRTNIKPYEILYVGNSNNDEWVYKSGARTLCVNPTQTNDGNKKFWHNVIFDMEHLSEIYPYILGSRFKHENII